MAFPVTAQDLHVEFDIDDAWVDVIDDVRYDGRVIINRGRPNERTRVSPARVTLTLENTNGKYTNLNPASPYYRKLNRNTRIRIRVGSDVRFIGEVAEWPARWDGTHTDQYMPIVAAGILRRLNQGNKGLLTPVERSVRATNPLVYWPLTDGTDAIEGQSGLGGRPLAVGTGTVEFGTIDGLEDGALYPDTSAGSLTASISGGSATAWHWEFFARQDAYDGAVAFRLYAGNSATHAIFRVVLQVSAIQAASLFITDLAGSVTDFVDGTLLAEEDFLERWHHYAVTAEQSGANVVAKFYIDGVLGATSTAAGTLDAPSLILLGHNIGTPTSTAHIAVGDSVDFSTAAEAMGGYVGEAAGRRIERLCSEEGITFESTGDLDDTAPMGAQTTATLVDNLEAAATADRGLLYEARTAVALAYRTRVSLYNPVPTLELDYDAAHLNLVPEPTGDDQHIWNDVTVTRSGSATSARSVLTTAVDQNHTLDVATVGTYDRGPVDANVETDDQLPLLADWIRSGGTWDEDRIPLLGVDLASDRFTASSALSDAATEVDVGHVISVDNPPASLPPDQLLLSVQGYNETIGRFERKFRWNTTPAWVREVWQMDTSGSTLVVARDTDDTSFKLATSAGPAWSTTAESYYLQLGGEAVKATAVVVDTVTFIGAGSAVHGNNASVQPDPHASTAAGDTMLLFAAIRNSGTGTVNLPSGWVSLANFGNMRVMGRHYIDGTGADDPTVTFADGAANADTSAQIATFRGLSLELDDGKYRRSAVSPQTLLNSSAQDIAYPALSVRRNGCVVILAGWKADDWSSVATPAAMDAEIGEPDTTTGDDQGIAWYYDIQTTATDIAAGSMVVTGGASAISRAVVLALRPLQTATVTRGINGASVSPTAGSAVNGWRLGKLGL